MDISIIIPLYKGTKYIKSWIEMIDRNMNIVRENGKDVSFEVLFINDYPQEIIELDFELAKQVNARVYNLPENRGIHGARIFGYYEASGKYISYFDQDDFIEDRFFESQLSCIGEGDVVVSDGYIDRFCVPCNKIIYGTEEKHKRILSIESFIKNKGCIISPGQVLMRKDAISRVWLDNTMKKNGVDDMLLWFTMLKDGKQFVINRERLYTHAGNGSNTSDDKVNMHFSMMEMLEIASKNNLLTEEEIVILKESSEHSYISSKIYAMMRVYEYWMHLKIHNHSLAEYFVHGGYSNVAIYGMGYLGIRLLEELKMSPIEVVFCIDRDAKNMECEIPIYEFHEVECSIGKADIIVITALSGYDEIERKIHNQYDIPVVSIKDVIVEMCEKRERGDCY